MAASKELKEQAQKGISARLEKYGKEGDFGVLYKKYSGEVPKSTFYRWVQAILPPRLPFPSLIFSVSSLILS